MYSKRIMLASISLMLIACALAGSAHAQRMAELV